MASSDPAETYTPMQKRLHWAVVALLLAQYLAFDGMGRPFHQLMDSGAGVYSTTVVAHIAIGLTVFVLAAWRVLLRVRAGAPPPPEDEPAPAKLAAKAVHVAIYALLLALPLSGAAAWFFQVGAAGGLHELGTTVLMWLVFVHVLAALVHQFWWKTNLIRRMT
jgi:cytochrome b561